MATQPDRRPQPFANRVEAGKELAGHLQRYAGRSDVVVLGLPRGGVPVAAVIAGALGPPLDVFTVRSFARASRIDSSRWSSVCGLRRNLGC